MNPSLLTKREQTLFTFSTTYNLKLKINSKKKKENELDYRSEKAF